MTDSTSDVNPYAAPTVQAVEVESTGRASAHMATVAWLMAVLINLPVPVMLGISCTRGPGQIGMLIGVLAFAGVGLILCRRVPSLMKSISLGSLVTAISQFFLILHMYVGMAAITICKLGAANGDLTGVVEITMTTVLTGVGLIIPSLILVVIGWVIRLIIR